MCFPATYLELSDEGNDKDGLSLAMDDEGGDEEGESETEREGRRALWARTNWYVCFYLFPS